MKNLLIIEPHMRGHHGVYLRWIIRATLDKNCRISIGTYESSLTHPLFKKMLIEFGNSLKIITLPRAVIDYMKNTSTGGLIRREVAYRKLFKRFYREAQKTFQPDLVLVPYLDYCIYATAILGSPFEETPWAGIVMRAAFHYKEMGIMGPNSRLLSLKKVLFFLLAYQKSLCVLFTIDPSLEIYIRDKFPAVAEKIHYLLEPPNFDGNISKDEARRILQIPQNVLIVLVYGQISWRKGIDALLAIVANQASLENVHLLIAGKQEAKIESLLKSHEGNQLRMSERLHQMNKFLSEEEEYIVFKASDIVWLGYREHYTMSGVIIQACRMGLPVISCKEGVIGWLTEKNNLGIVIDRQNEKDIAESVQKLMVKNAICMKYGKSNKCHFSGHTIDQFVKKIFVARV